MDFTADDSFLSVISGFCSRDFCDSSNSEVILLKHLFQDNIDRGKDSQEVRNGAGKDTYGNCFEEELVDVVEKVKTDAGRSRKREAFVMDEGSSSSYSARKIVLLSSESSNSSVREAVSSDIDDLIFMDQFESGRSKSKTGYSSSSSSKPAPKTLVLTSSSSSLLSTAENDAKRGLYDSPTVLKKDTWDFQVNNDICFASPSSVPRLLDPSLFSKPNFPVSIRGETRLNVTFLNLGDAGDIPQRFGKNNCGIPNGLSGTHEMYDQRWKFEVKHNRHDMSILITWKIMNLTSKAVLTVTETPQDAMVREQCGRTICNMVLKTALENRARELETSIAGVHPASTKLASTHNLIRVLRPKRCTVGLLFFGLLHEKVQRNFADQLVQRCKANEEA
jgi:hypothetical protein